MALYAAGNAPTIAMLDPADVTRFQDKALDLKRRKMGRGGDRPEFRPDNLVQWEAVGIPLCGGRLWSDL